MEAWMSGSCNTTVFATKGKSHRHKGTPKPAAARVPRQRPAHATTTRFKPKSDSHLPAPSWSSGQLYYSYRWHENLTRHQYWSSVPTSCRLMVRHCHCYCRLPRWLVAHLSQRVQVRASST